MDGSCLPGAVLQERYRIEAQLALGRNDVSYRALDLVTGNRVTVKELTDGFADPIQHERAVQQFHHQFRTLSVLSHPCLPRAHALVEQDGRLYLIVDYIDALTLEAVVLQAGELPSETHVLHWAWQLMDVLEYLHNQLIIYRDLRPPTVLVSAVGEVHLVDFGIAKMTDPAKAGGRTVFRAVGSPEYAAPETFGMSRTSPRTDIYPLGAVIYFALTGSAPPPSADRVIRNAQLRPIRQVNPSVSPVLEAAVLRMMALKTQDRPATIAEVRAMLTELRQPEAFQPGSLRPPMPWVNPPDAMGEKPTGSPQPEAPPSLLGPTSGPSATERPGPPGRLPEAPPPAPAPVPPRPATPPVFVPRHVASEAPAPPPVRTELAPVPRTRMASWVLAVFVLVILAGGVAFGVWYDRTVANHSAPPSPAHGQAAPLRAV